MLIQLWFSETIALRRTKDSLVEIWRIDEKICTMLHSAKT